VKLIDLKQGSKEWNQHRATHFNASEAAAMLGISPYKTRDELLREKATGLVPEVDAATQRRFDEGHRFEAFARPVAEETIDEDLYPCVGVVEGTKLSASFDGLTIDETIVWEHKTINNELRAAMPYGDSWQALPLHYRVQLEQQLIVSNADKALFMASAFNDEGDMIECRHRWYTPDIALRQRILDGWRQFEKDLAEYTLPETQSVIVAEPVQTLPAVSVQIDGQIAVRENFKTFEIALRDFLDNRLIREPQTDQDFVDLDLQIKAMKEAETKLDAAEAMMLAQIESVDQAKRHKDMLAKLVREHRLMAEKLLTSEKERRRAELVLAARQTFTAHLAELQCGIDGVRMDVPTPDFATAIKGLKTLKSIQDKLDTALVNGKITADQHAADVRSKLLWLDANAADHRSLLADLQALISKPFDDFTLAVTARIERHQREQAARLEAERERIRAEEAARLERERQEHEQAEQAQLNAAQNQARERQMEQLDESPLRHAIEPPIPLRNEPLSSDIHTVKLGDINAAISPLSINADGLAQLGFKPAGNDRAAKLYRADEFPRIVQMIICKLRNASISPQQRKAA